MALAKDVSFILGELRSRNDETRLRASSDLATWISSRGTTVDAHVRSIQELAPRLTALINSNDLTDKLAGLNAIDTLLEATQDASIAARLATQPWLAIPSVDPLVMAHAAKTYAKLVVRGGALVKNVDLQVQTAMEWLQDDRNESRRYAAALVFRELARTAPFSISDRVENILDYLWTALRDPKVNIREAAASALSGCLKIASTRDNTTRNECYAMVFEQAQKGFKMNTGDTIHGSLLGYKELFTNGNMFMQERYDDVCEQILSYKDHREPLVRRAVIELIPTLASYYHQKFIAGYLHRCMVYLLGQLKKDRDRTTSYHAVGHVALAVTNSMAPYLDAVLSSVKEGLQSRGRKNAPSEASIFQCISMLATAVGQALTKHMHELLDLMFAYGLSESLVRALIDLSTHIPPLLPTIQERLLNLLCLILGGEPFKTPGVPLQMRPTAASITRDMSVLNTAQEINDVPTLTLAITTLGSFDFSGILLHELVRDTITNYLDHDSREVRLAAAQTCCKLFSRDPIIFQTSNHSINLVTEVLEKLLVCAIADPDAYIRQSTLASLDTKFDRHLAQAENVKSIFLAINDEVYPIREIAIKIIGRISLHNPAYVMPSLRKALIQLLTELEYSTYATNREECATLLGMLVGASARLSKPYCLSVLRVLLPKARDVSAGVSSAIMLALGELAKVGGEDMLPRLDEYMSLIIEMLHDQSSIIKRDAALHTLGLVSSYAGYVIEPYIKYPTLLGTLINILKSENVPATRRETIKVMGILGALDPYKQPHQSTEVEDNDLPLNPTDPSHPMNIGPSHDEYYPTVAFQALLSILRDSSLANHHTAVIEAVMYIFNSLRLRCVTFLPQVIPAFLGAMRTVQQGPAQEKYYFENLSKLIKVVGQHIRNHLPPILALIRDSWASGPSLQVILVDLVEKIAVALEGEFKVYLPTLLPLMLTAFDAEFTERRLPCLQRILHAFGIFGANLEEYLHLVIPVIVRTFERYDAPMALRKHAIQVTGILCRKINFSDHASRVIHPLARTLVSGPPDLRNDCMDALCSLVTQIGSDFAIFVPMLNKAMVSSRIQHSNYDQLITKLLRGEPLPDLGYVDTSTGVNTELDPAADAGVNKLPVNQQQLKREWETTERAKADDWKDWYKRLSVALLKASPSLSLRACSGLAEVYQPLASDLFNAAFVSCWSELYESYQDDLVKAIDMALASTTVPPEITQTLLNLAEFMEHDDKSLPIGPRTLGQYAQKCHAFAKALHYKELEWSSEPTAETIESLIRINNQLQQPDVAVGILTHAQSIHHIELKEDWYEKLEQWDDALAAYERKQHDDPNNFDYKYGMMRCLHALGEWESLSDLARANWRSASSEQRRKIAPLAAGAAWGLAQWEAMDDYIAVLKHESADRAWFRAILSIHRNQFVKAQQHVNRARDSLDTELRTLVGESYNRAYNQIVRVQMLSELEEIIQYKESGDNRERRVVIQKTWMKRLKGCQRDVEVWQRILKVRALVVSPRENMEMWIKFANLCRKSGRLGLAEKTLNSLFGEDQDFESTSMQGPPHVIYAHLKYMWATGAREDTLAYLQDFTGRLTQDLGFNPDSDEPNAASELAASGQLQEYTKLLARCYYKLGEWQSALQPDWGSQYVDGIIKSYFIATNLDRKWYKAWHAWALANSEVVNYYNQAQGNQTTNDPMPPEILTGHIVPAVRAFFQSIALSPGNSLQDTLRLLTLWFKYGYHGQVAQTISEGFNSVSVDIWLEVIPQLIARIHAPSAGVRKLIHHILSDVGKAHPQALVYALTVASKYPNPPRRRAALAIIDRMSEHSANLVDQARLVSQELIRVAILWHEMWHEGLEEASRLYYGDGNVEAMFATLDPLHDLLEKGPETLREIAFQQTFGRDLQDARESCRRFQTYGEVSDLNQAWDLYYQIFKRLARALPSFSVLELQQVSPKLLAVKDLELAVPGTYHVGKPIIRIVKFAESFDVLTSKQRPRKLKVAGSDGKDHAFLLKGHEDLRQDERVMQLFGLVNTLLSKDPETFKRHLMIQPYPIIPLAPNSGLLGWVDNTDTLHVLVKNYRDPRKILLNIEHRIMLQMAPDYDHMMLMQKIEVFEYALDNTTGQDLYRVLWLKSRNSEAWLDRRTQYTRTLATMSMVGHILGLGDRHPSNLLLDRLSGSVVHVDFGDCFEVAMVRDKYPERVPFRLTRMLIQAMEVSGIEGTFRITCENSMRVLRDNKESIMAVLEAFVHDPLINWRLITTGRRGGGGTGNNERAPKRTGVDETNPLDDEANEALNQRALQVVDRVQQKLTGRDFKPTQVLDVKDQVQKLILQATSVENLCQTFIGWCAFW